MYCPMKFNLPKPYKFTALDDNQNIIEGDDRECEKEKCAWWRLYQMSNKVTGLKEGACAMLDIALGLDK